MKKEDHRAKPFIGTTRSRHKKSVFSDPAGDSVNTWHDHPAHSQGGLFDDQHALGDSATAVIQQITDHIGKDTKSSRATSRTAGCRRKQAMRPSPSRSLRLSPSHLDHLDVTYGRMERLRVEAAETEVCSTFCSNYGRSTNSPGGFLVYLFAPFWDTKIPTNAILTSCTLHACVLPASAPRVLP